MNEIPTTEAREIADLAVEAMGPTELGESGHVVGVALPHGADFRVIDLEEHLEFPARTRGTVYLDDAQSLVGFVARYAAEDRSGLYADRDAFRIVTLLNGAAGAERPGWGDHRAVLNMRTTPEWTRWAAHDRQYMSQIEFAELIEEGIDDVITPPAADMLELSLTFQANTSVVFKQGANLASGERQLTFEETIDAKAGARGELVIPKTFSLRLRPFEGAEYEEVVARLRFRLRDGKLTLGYFLERPEELRRESFQKVVEIVASETDVPLYFGQVAS